MVFSGRFFAKILSSIHLYFFNLLLTQFSAKIQLLHSLIQSFGSFKSLQRAQVAIIIFFFTGNAHTQTALTAFSDNFADNFGALQMKLIEFGLIKISEWIDYWVDIVAQWYSWIERNVICLLTKMARIIFPLPNLLSTFLLAHLIRSFDRSMICACIFEKEKEEEKEQKAVSIEKFK